MSDKLNTKIEKLSDDKAEKIKKKKKKKQKYNLPRHKFWFIIGRPLVHLYMKLTSNFVRTKSGLKKGQQYLLLGNHTSDIDPLMIICSMSGVVHALASDHLFKYPIFDGFIRHIAEPIPIVRAQMDLTSIVEVLQAKKDGASILIFPEANTCYNGRTCYIAPSIAKLVKQLKLPVAIFNSKGGYLSRPRWSDSWRKGKITCEVSCVIEADELAAMPLDELYDVICKSLYVNEFDWQLENEKNGGMVYYHAKDLLEGAERSLYQCPKCGSLCTMHSHGDSMSCEKCGYEVTMNHYGFLEGEDVVFDRIDDWDNWEREQAAKMVSEGNYDESGQIPLLFSPSDVLYKSKRAEANRLAAEGSFALYADRLEFVGHDAYETDENGEPKNIGPKTFVWKLEDISKISCVNTNNVQIAVGEKEYYEIHSDTTYRPAYAFMFYFYCLKRKAQGKPLDFFGM